MTATRLIGQITLGDPKMTRLQNFHRQSFDQEFSFDLARGNMMGATHPHESIAFDCASQAFIDRNFLDPITSIPHADEKILC
jgi:hypothetical protein